MNYLQYKNLYPKTLTKYFNWVVNHKETDFSNFFKYLGFEETNDLHDYPIIFSINNPSYLKILKADTNFFSDKNIFYHDENSISIEANKGIESVLKCIEILLNHNKL